MHRLLILTGAALLVLSCQRQETQTQTAAATPAPTSTVARPQNLGKARVNQVIPLDIAEPLAQSSLRDAKGREQDTFKSGEPIHLIVTPRDTPRGLQVSARWYDAKNKQLAEDRKVLGGEKIATFVWAGKKLKPGKYHVVSYWGGNVAGEHSFTVTK